MKDAWRSLAAVCALVIGVYAYTVHSGFLESLILNAADTYYNLLVQGFRSGQVSLKKEVPPGLAELADPYDPAANVRYRSTPYGVHDLSYYRGKLYLYFGVTPALILFWPFTALTGHYLFHRQAVAIFCGIGFLAGVGLLCAVWRRYFAEVSIGVVAACALALGLATGVPILLSSSDVYQVPIGCAYMLTMLALAAIWCALHEPERSCRWLAAASVAYGLAVGARPSLLFGAVILLVPVVQSRPERRQMMALLLAATVPIALISFGLVLYNAARFDNPFEFGMRYQLAGERQATQQFFSLRYFWFNFRVYFLEPARWSARFPFVHEIAVPSLPAGHSNVEKPFGILTNIPLVWLAAAVPLAWRGSSGRVGSILRWFVLATALLFGVCAMTLGLFCGSNFRYEMEFLPALVLLAMIGILGLERALADRPVWRRAGRWGWGLLLGFSMAFNLLASLELSTQVRCSVGAALLQTGRVPEAIDQYEQALWIKPDFGEAHNGLGSALLQAGQVQGAIGHFQQALRLKPVSAVVYYNLAGAYAAAGRYTEAIAATEKAVELARAAAQPELVKKIEARLELYRRGHAYHQSVEIAGPGQR